jgi:hypothetical protein
LERVFQHNIVSIREKIDIRRMDYLLEKVRTLRSPFE